MSSHGHWSSANEDSSLRRLYHGKGDICKMKIMEREIFARRRSWKGRYLQDQDHRKGDICKIKIMGREIFATNREVWYAMMMGLAWVVGYMWWRGYIFEEYPGGNNTWHVQDRSGLDWVWMGWMSGRGIFWAPLKVLKLICSGEEENGWSSERRWFKLMMWWRGLFWKKMWWRKVKMWRRKVREDGLSLWCDEEVFYEEEPGASREEEEGEDARLGNPLHRVCALCIVVCIVYCCQLCALCIVVCIVHTTLFCIVHCTYYNMCIVHCAYHNVCLLSYLLHRMHCALCILHSILNCILKLGWNILCRQCRWLHNM